MKLKQILVIIVGVSTLALLTFVSLQLLFPKAEPRLEVEYSNTPTEETKESIHYTAIGDSLTEGVGDISSQGGFVPMISNSLQEEFNLTSIEVDNYGVSGDRSDQILKRIQEQTEIQENIAKADIITLTVGGNDLMRVIQRNIFGLSIKTFEKPLIEYQEVMTELLSEIRLLNSEAPLYVLGIYNPFYVYFPEIVDMQTIVENWNDGTKEVVNQIDNAYFIPINALIASGSSGQAIGDETVEEDTQESTENDLNIVKKNDFLYDEDKFHPNHLGYQLIAQAVKTEIIRTKADWLPKEE